MLETIPLVTSLPFVDNLGFIAAGRLVKKVAKSLENIAQAILGWEKINAVTYDMSKRETVLFSKLHCQRLNKELREAKIKVGDEKISFNKKTMS